MVSVVHPLLRSNAGNCDQEWMCSVRSLDEVADNDLPRCLAASLPRCLAALLPIGDATTAMDFHLSQSILRAYNANSRL